MPFASPKLVTASTFPKLHYQSMRVLYLLSLIALCQTDAFVALTTTRQRASNYATISIFPVSSSHQQAQQQQLLLQQRQHQTTRSSLGRKIGSSSGSNDDQVSKPGIFEKIARILSQTYNAKLSSPSAVKSEQDKKRVAILTLLRVGIPSILAGVAACVAFPGIALELATMLNDPGTFAVLSQDSSQFVQNFLTVAGLLFSILVGQTYYFLYTQQESIYYALFQEVTEAKSLLEQVALVCQGRSMYGRCLQSISRYVQDDLKQIQRDPAVLLSARPVDDPLESIMYMTSVGVPSTVYETVRSLREARAHRLGALQRKLPSIHMLLLWVLAAIELVSFPLLGCGTQTIGGYNLLTVEGVLFGVMTFGVVLTMRVVGELWRPAGGAYNVDSVLSVMVSGLEDELNARMSGQKVQGQSSNLAPSGARESTVKIAPSATTLKTPSKAIEKEIPAGANIQMQGPDVGVVAVRVYKWIRRRVAKKAGSSRPR